MGGISKVEITNLDKIKCLIKFLTCVTQKFFHRTSSYLQITSPNHRKTTNFDLYKPVNYPVNYDLTVI